MKERQCLSPSSRSCVPAPANPCHASFAEAAKWASEVPPEEPARWVAQAWWWWWLPEPPGTTRECVTYFYSSVCLVLQPEGALSSIFSRRLTSPLSLIRKPLHFSHTWPYWKSLVMCLNTPSQLKTPNPHLPYTLPSWLQCWLNFYILRL